VHKLRKYKNLINVGNIFFSLTNVTNYWTSNRFSTLFFKKEKEKKEKKEQVTENKKGKTTKQLHQQSQ
jgi:hypothetical protein